VYFRYVISRKVDGEKAVLVLGEPFFAQMYMSAACFELNWTAGTIYIHIHDSS
jgi:hypothetical protein